MDDIDLGVPAPLLESLPKGSDDTARDMERAVEGWEQHINAALESADDDVAVLTDAVERLDERRTRYDEFVPELRAWGQSPIYAIAWRNLHADLIEQLYEQGGDDIDRERNARLVEDGIRLSDTE